MGLEDAFIIIPVLLFSIVIHEVSHGWIAYKYGDPTAKMMGRLTLNPVPHIDIFGTILLPAILILSKAGVVFGYAKPVPVDYKNFRNPLKDQAVVSFAGPLSNILVAAVCFILAIVIININPSGIFWQKMVSMIVFGIQINLILANFNLIPIPPLDGSWILLYLLPENMAIQYEKIRPYGFFIIIGLLFFNLLNPLFIPYYYIFNKILMILRG